jgi:hypothetical protein
MVTVAAKAVSAHAELHEKGLQEELVHRSLQQAGFSWLLPCLTTAALLGVWLTF